MSARTRSPELEDLLQQSAWARRLARHLVRQRGDADDLLQEAWVVATAKAASGETPSRPWLAGVLRVLGLNQSRAAGRRRQRESEAVTQREAVAKQEQARPDDLLDQVETQRRLSEALLALPEPYRTTVVLRYFEELSAAEIARRTQVPAGTVRWRLKEGLARLRQQLDDRVGDRASFAVALVKFAERRTSRTLPRLALGGGLTAAAAGVAVFIGLQLTGSSSTRAPATSANQTKRTNEAPPAPERESDMKTRIGVLAAVAGLVTQTAPGTEAGAAATPQVMPASKQPRFWVPLGVGPIKGPPTAKVTILAFLDYQSPFCRKASDTMAPLLAAHAKDVRYQVIHHPLPFHRLAPDASKAALAAGQQGKFWEMHDTLLANQTALAATDIEGYANKVGLDLERFRADLAGPTVTNQAELEEANAQSVKIAAVPTFFLNGRAVGGAQPRAVFERALAEELAYADAVLKTGVPPADLYTTITKHGASELPNAGPRRAPGGEEGGKEGPTMDVFQAANRVLTDNTSMANACYQEALVHRPNLAGKVIIDLRLEGGQPPLVLLKESTMNFPKVDNCIVQALKKLTYPQVAAGRSAVGVHRLYTFPSPPTAAAGR